MSKPEKLFAAAFLFSLFAATFAFADSPMAQDQERNFRRGQDGGFRGNERSELPGRFAPGRLNYGGNGCPAGTMNTVFSPDGLSFTILFDKFVADTTAGGGRLARMICNANIPITLPEGQQMEITRVDYRGFVNVPAGGRGILHSEFNFVDLRGGERERDRINIRFNFVGPRSENYELSTGSMNAGQGLQNTEVSPCGGETILHIRNDAQVMAPRGQEAQLTVDSIDGSSNAVYYVNWRSCVKKPEPADNNGRPQCGRQGNCGPNSDGRGSGRNNQR